MLSKHELSSVEGGQEPAARSKNGVQKKRRPAFSKNMVQFPYKSDGFEQKRVQQKSLSWRKIRTLARGVSPTPKARGRGPLGRGGGVSARERGENFLFTPVYARKMA